jgi:hypothetical protein
VFQGHTVAELCAQLQNPAQTRGRNLQALLQHVSEDPLVRWAWQPGGRRSVPPMSHAAFVAAFRTWADGRSACP